MKNFNIFKHWLQKLHFIFDSSEYQLDPNFLELPKLNIEAFLFSTAQKGDDRQ